MEKQVNYREKKEYISEDGRRIEVWARVGTVALNNDDPQDPTENIENDNLFYGILIIGTPIGPKEIKFAMSNASTLEEAFASYNEAAEKVVKDLEKRQEEWKRTQEAKIVQAPASALNSLNKPLIQV